MIEYNVSETIHASPSEIFPYLATVSLYDKWMNLQSAEVTSGETGRGQQWRARTREGAFLIENDSFDDNRMVGFRTIEGPFQWTGGFTLDPAADGATRVTSQGKLTMSGIRRLMEPFMSGGVRKGEAAELMKLKSLVEKPETPNT